MQIVKSFATVRQECQVRRMREVSQGWHTAQTLDFPVAGIYGLHRAGESDRQHLPRESVPERTRARARAHSRDMSRLQQRPERRRLRLTLRDNHPVSVRRAVAPPTRETPVIVKREISIKITLPGERHRSQEVA